MVPTMSILNPEYTFSVSKKQTAAGTADMMSHTMENYFSMENADCQKFMAEGLLRTMIKNGPAALAQPDNYEARANLMWAGTHAINGVVGDGCSPAWCVHPMEHELSAFYDITHGEGLAILTPAWMERKRQTMRQSLKSTPPIIGDVASCIRPEDYLTMA